MTRFNAPITHSHHIVRYERFVCTMRHTQQCASSNKAFTRNKTFVLCKTIHNTVERKPQCGSTVTSCVDRRRTKHFHCVDRKIPYVPHPCPTRTTSVRRSLQSSRTSTTSSPRSWQNDCVNTPPMTTPSPSRTSLRSRLGPHERGLESKLINNLLERGLIRPSTSPTASPLFFTGKRDPDGKDTARGVIDYRNLNQQTVKWRYPLPHVEDLIDKIRTSSLFTSVRAVRSLRRIDPNRDGAGLVDTPCERYIAVY